MLKILTILLLALSCTLAIAQSTHLTILHTNDHHGRLVPYNIPQQQQIGGMAPRMTLIRQVRKELAQRDNNHLLLLDCGDINTGEPLSDMLKGKPDIEVMNLMGYDALAVGNHEFDLTLEELKKQESWAKFPFLSANVVYRDTGQLLFRPSIILQRGTLKIGIFGLTAQDTPAISTHGDDLRLQFLPYEHVLSKLIATLRPQVDYLIGIMHVSHHRVVQLIQQFPQIDMVVGGHSHMVVPAKTIGKTLVVEAGAYGQIVGRFDLEFRGKKLHQWQHQMIAINLGEPIYDRETGTVLCAPSAQKFAADPQVEALLEPYHKRVEKILDAKIGFATADLHRGIRSTRPISSPLGNLITDAFLDHTKSDIALHNTGGIRTDIVQGDITYRDIKRVLPFSNTLVVYKLTGTQVIDVLKDMLYSNGPANGRLLEVAGVEFAIQDELPVNVKIAGQPWRSDKVYKVVTNSFIARGGDGYTIFQKFTDKEDVGEFLADVVAQYIKRQSPLAPVRESRFRWIKRAKVQNSQGK